MRKAEIIALVTLLVGFIAFALFAEQVAQETTPVESASSFNARDSGSKAFYLLLESQGFRVTRLRSPWNTLTAQNGLLVVLEPLDPRRPVSEGEIASLKRWLKNGGSILYMVTAPARPLDKKDTVLGDIAITEAPKLPPTQIVPAARSSPYFREIPAISVESPVRLLPADNAPYEALLADNAGALVLTKPLGKGRVLVAATGGTARNNTIRRPGNALFLINVALETVNKTTQDVVFDEYHHGIGFTQEGGTPSLLAATPRPLRLALMFGGVLTLIMVFNSNRRFGRPLTVPVPPYRSSSDHVEAVARLYQKARAGDLALKRLYTDLLRDMAKQLELPPDADRRLLLERAAKAYRSTPDALQQMLMQYEQAINTPNLPESYLLSLAQNLEAFRRNHNLVG